MYRTPCLIALLALPILAPAQPTFHTMFRFDPKDSVYQPPVQVAGGHVYGVDMSDLFQLHQAAGAWKIKRLGIPPFDRPLLPAPGGVLYAAQSTGGTGSGAIYLLSPPVGSGNWTQTTLYTFTGAEDGRYPEGNLVLGADGSLYGSTNTGGLFNKGTVFQLQPPATGTVWTLTVLYNFAGAPSDAYGPATLTLASDGSLYGAANGGSGVCWQAFPCGLVFHLTPTASSAWQETIVYEFQKNSDGQTPGALVPGPNGTLYGVAALGGLGRRAGFGLIFALTPPSSPGASWTKSDIYEFARPDGITPNALVLASDGNLYGTNYGGAIDCPGFAHGCGSVFELIAPAAPGDPWTEKTVHKFGGPDGAKPVGLTLGADGNLYGATQEGGSGNGANYGPTIFRVIP